MVPSLEFCAHPPRPVMYPERFVYSRRAVQNGRWQQTIIPRGPQPGHEIFRALRTNRFCAPEIDFRVGPPPRWDDIIRTVARRWGSALPKPQCVEADVSENPRQLLTIGDRLAAHMLDVETAGEIPEAQRFFAAALTAYRRSTTYFLATNAIGLLASLQNIANLQWYVRGAEPALADAEQWVSHAQRMLHAHHAGVTARDHVLPAVESYGDMLAESRNLPSAARMYGAAFGIAHQHHMSRRAGELREKYDTVRSISDEWAIDDFSQIGAITIPPLQWRTE